MDGVWWRSVAFVEMVSTILSLSENHVGKVAGGGGYDCRHGCWYCWKYVMPNTSLEPTATAPTVSTMRENSPVAVAQLETLGGYVFYESGATRILPAVLVLFSHVSNLRSSLLHHDPPPPFVASAFGR